MRTSSPSAVHLHAGAVELPLDRRQAGVAERLGDVGRAGRQHRLDRVQHRQPHRFERRPDPRSARARRCGRGRPRASRRAGRRRSGCSAAVATASVITPASAPCRSSPVSSRRTKSTSGSVAREKRSVSSAWRAACDPAPAVPASSVRIRSTSRISTEGSAAGSTSCPVGGPPAHPDAALARGAGEEPDRHLDLVRIERAQELGERLHLRLPRPGGADRAGGLDEGGEQHAAHAATEMRAAT